MQHGGYHPRAAFCYILLLKQNQPIMRKFDYRDKHKPIGTQLIRQVTMGLVIHQCIRT